MAPLAVAVHALPVISPFKVYLADILPLPVLLMAFPAGKYRTGRIVMMASLAAVGHLRHLTMYLMRKYNGSEPFRHIIKCDYFRAFICRMMNRNDILTGTKYEIGILLSGIFSIVTCLAV
jgi:hypothetical protein